MSDCHLVHDVNSLARGRSREERSGYEIAIGKMKIAVAVAMMKNSTMEGERSEKKLPCKASLGGFLKGQKGKLYIIRRCILMLLCWQD
ncbi:hypothetical protein SAY86_021190 [Trapa natans]|uniref:Uncharacterized protein n=1 Tax=Trapa natans TaxID=22666 RepID=A0AAN7RLD9_TRANT|nr:hypothetical protein SAY86_021190 [Trapa natans]